MRCSELILDSTDGVQEPEYLEAQAIPWNMEYDPSVGAPVCQGSFSRVRDARLMRHVVKEVSTALQSTSFEALLPVASCAHTVISYHKLGTPMGNLCSLLLPQPGTSSIDQ